VKILVTGGAGFIGSHLSEEFLRRNHSGTILDEFSSGNRSNLKAFISSPLLQVVEVQF
jgi:nucleoside-diphosphate-sugar epimerase